MINSVVLVGHLGNDPELKYTQGGRAVTTFRLAVDRPQRKGQERVTDWLNIVCFGVIAESCAQYLKSGSLVAVEGAIHSRTWKTKEGESRYNVEIYGEVIKFLDKKEKTNEQDNMSGM